MHLERPFKTEEYWQMCFLKVHENRFTFLFIISCLCCCQTISCEKGRQRYLPGTSKHRQILEICETDVAGWQKCNQVISIWILQAEGGISRGNQSWDCCSKVLELSQLKAETHLQQKENLLTAQWMKLQGGWSLLSAHFRMWQTFTVALQDVPCASWMLSNI